MAAEIMCPRCHSSVDPALRFCCQCGVDLGLTAVLTDTALPDRVLPMDVRIAPETLVPRLGELLIERGVLGPDDLEAALDFQRKKISKGEPCLIGQALVELGFVDQYSIDEIVTVQIFQLQHKLERTNKDLEQRVAERTADLQQALSKLTELNQLKSNFISNISHELRTPLTHIKGYLDILSDQSMGPLSTSQENAINVLLRSEERLEQLIDDLIQFSLAVKGELNLSLDALDIRQLVEAYLPQTLKKAQAKDIDLEVLLPKNLPRILADEDKMQWVFNQLLDNGIKFTPSGGSVTLSAKHAGDLVKFKISDSGIGIPEERIEEIFHPFHQLDGSVTRRYSGTGLGLAMVHRILEAHGVSLDVDSKPGEGTRCTFLLPVAETDYDG
jgi:signal transduction histidine kinase